MHFLYLSQLQEEMAQTNLHNPLYNDMTSYNKSMMSLSAVLLFVGVQPTYSLEIVRFILCLPVNSMHIKCE